MRGLILEKCMFEKTKCVLKQAGILHSCRLKPKNCFLMATVLVLGGQKQDFNLGATLMQRGRVDLGGSLYELVHCKAVLRHLHSCTIRSVTGVF